MLEPLDRMKSQYGGSIYKRPLPKNPKWNQAWEYTLQGKSLKKLLVNIYPLIIVKRKQVKVALDHWKKLST